MTNKKDQNQETTFNSIQGLLASQISLNKTLNLAKENSNFLELLEQNVKVLKFRGKRFNNFISTVIKTAEENKESQILVRYLNNRFPKKTVDKLNFLELCFQSQQKTAMESTDFDLFVIGVLKDIADKKAKAEAEAKKAEAKKAEADKKADK